jgi:hypothetical protein
MRKLIVAALAAFTILTGTAVTNAHTPTSATPQAIIGQEIAHTNQVSEPQVTRYGHARINRYTLWRLKRAVWRLAWTVRRLRYSLHTHRHVRVA